MWVGAAAEQPTFDWIGNAWYASAVFRMTFCRLSRNPVRRTKTPRGTYIYILPIFVTFYKLQTRAGTEAKEKQLKMALACTYRGEIIGVSVYPLSLGLCLKNPALPTFSL